MVEDGGVLPGLGGPEVLPGDWTATAEESRRQNSPGKTVHKKTWWKGDVQECTQDGSSRDWSEGRRPVKSGNTVGPDNISGDWKWLKMGAAEFPKEPVNNGQRYNS